jgi:hypothetical protein
MAMQREERERKIIRIYSPYEWKKATTKHKSRRLTLALSLALGGADGV